MSGYTPGPWEVAEGGMYFCGEKLSSEYYVRRPGDDVGIASEIIDPETRLPSEANAQAIAATPELIASLTETLHSLEFWVSNHDTIYDGYAAVDSIIGRARAVLAKAGKVGA